VLTVNFGDAGISTGNKGGTLPKGARILDVIVEIITAFNAGTTNVLTVGTNASINNIVNAASVDETVVASTRVDIGIGGSIARAADIDVSAKYTQSGAAATAGKAEITIAYEGGWAT
jgi:hypothetical protein